VRCGRKVELKAKATMRGTLVPAAKKGSEGCRCRVEGLELIDGEDHNKVIDVPGCEWKG
jgi:hypothetical protein